MEREEQGVPHIAIIQLILDAQNVKDVEYYSHEEGQCHADADHFNLYRLLRKRAVIYLIVLLRIEGGIELLEGLQNLQVDRGVPNQDDGVDDDHKGADEIVKDLIVIGPYGKDAQKGHDNCGPDRDHNLGEYQVKSEPFRLQLVYPFLGQLHKGLSRCLERSPFVKVEDESVREERQVNEVKNVGGA